MKLTEKVILALAFVLTIAVGAGLFMQKSVNLGSVANDGVSYYKNITTSNASTTDPVAVKGGAGVLGSVVIVKTSATALAVYDGNGTTTGATLISTIPASVAAGTYTFDVAVQKGVVLGGSAGFTGDYTITYR